MTSTVAPEANWGERRDASRRRQRWVAGGVMALAAGVFVWLVPADSSPASDTVRLMSALAFVTLAGLGGFLSWRVRDEIQRTELINGLAVTGVAAMVLVPLAGMLAPVFHIGDPPITAWLASIVAGFATRLFQRVRA